MTPEGPAYNALSESLEGIMCASGTAAIKFAAPEHCATDTVVSAEKLGYLLQQAK